MSAAESGNLPDRVRFTRDGIRRGFLTAQPLAVSVLLYGAVFGVLAGESGLGLWHAALMSLLIYSGSAQLTALQIGVTTALLPQLIAAVVLLNARYLLFGAALRPWLSWVRPWQAYATLFFNGDTSWALSMKRYAGGERDAGFVFGSGAAMFAPWLVGTLIGHQAASWVPDPKALGLDFMLAGFAGAIGVGAWRGRVDLAPAIAAAVTSIICWRWLPSGWHIVGAGVAGALVAAWRYPSAEIGSEAD